jgi:hypothetical protein
MNIIINDKRKVFAIQEEFNRAFPYLKLEFFAKSNSATGRSPGKYIKNNSETLGNCRTIHQGGGITVHPNMTVADLEQGFRETYGLNIQVFRKSGKAWLETTITDGWTLEEQNRQGEDLSKLEV